MHEAAIVPCGTYEPAAVRTALLQALDAVGGLGWVTAGMKIAINAA